MENVNGKINVPYIKSALAAAMAQLGDVDGALDLIEESIAQVERPDWEERWYFAEIVRIKGTLLSAKGDSDGAEGAFSPLSIAPGASRRNRGSCTRPPATRASCATGVGSEKPTNWSRRSTVGSPRVSPRRT